MSGSGNNGETMVPCEGSVGWVRVSLPLPLEIDRGVDGFFVLDERPDGPVYVSLDSSS